MIRYEWTGEYREAEEGEWILCINRYTCQLEPSCIIQKHPTERIKDFILRRMETEDGRKNNV